MADNLFFHSLKSPYLDEIFIVTMIEQSAEILQIKCWEPLLFHYLNSSGVKRVIHWVEIVRFIFLVTDEVADSGALRSLLHTNMTTWVRSMLCIRSERQHIFNFLLNTNWVYFPILYQVPKLGQLCGRNHRAALTDTIFLVLRLVKVEKLISI